MLSFLLLAMTITQPAAIPIGYSAELGNDYLSGIVHDNVSNRKGQGGGFKPLSLRAYPGQNIFHDKDVGLNFEHVFNGTKADHDLSMFTPRRDRCTLEVLSHDRVSLHWPVEHSSWGLECRMTYTLANDGVEMDFRVRPTRDRFPLGYCAMMWASYMHRTRERPYHFYGVRDGKEQWLSFGENLPEGGFETGTVACQGVPPLPYDEGAQTLNLIENPRKQFVRPFFYGLVDGDGDLATQDDTLVYIMMFDQREPIRFALWNFITDANKKPDPHSPAWDWQYVIQQPTPGKEYGYRAKLVVRPWRDRAEVEAIYRNWEFSRHPTMDRK